jgi:hypothetical protein
MRTDLLNESGSAGWLAKFIEELPVDAPADAIPGDSESKTEDVPPISEVCFLCGARSQDMLWRSDNAARKTDKRRKKYLKKSLILPI